MSPVGGIWAHAAMRVASKTLVAASKTMRAKISVALRPLNAELQPILARNATPAGRQPVHPAAWLRQQKRVGKWYSSNAYANVHAAVRRYLSTGPSGSGAGPRFDRTKFPVSNTSRQVAQLTGRAPFASTLRPNLTGGALPRTAGGYSAAGSGRAGGARYFSHTPAAPAQVVQNVSQAMRAFWLSGQRAVYEGTDAEGNARYRAFNVAHDEARKRLAKVSFLAPGSYIDFRINPTVTALSPLAVAFPFATAEAFGMATKPQAGAATLNDEGFLDVLSVDFTRALKDLTMVMSDLKKLSVLGDLPISLEDKNCVLRVRFPGVDAETVSRLCDDVGVERGVVRQDSDFDDSVGVALALKFPFAPDQKTRTLSSPSSGMSEAEEAFYAEYNENPWLSSPEPEEGYESASPPLMSYSGERCSDEIDDLEGIYRFIEECDRARSRGPF
ncbi:hypothetical protein GQ53DRAFT_771281 [Thozetella sp. PMI_491]|nr:hypothetical protein GQ53DRAFT_771281 [Thozetella sp. PMI_491]